MADIFISYSRADSEFVGQLVNSLKEVNRDVWVDFDDIAFGSNWWQEIVDAIESAPVGVFVISPDSIFSEYCSLEIAQLFQNHKKIVPIVARKPSGDEIDRLPEFIRELNWIIFDGKDFQESIGNLVDTIDTDLGAVKEHTRLLVRARDWQRAGHSRDLLSRGTELAEFLPMLDRDDLTVVQDAFLDESLRAAQARYNLWRFVFGFFGGMLSFSFYLVSVYRGVIFSPDVVTLAIAAGEIFGVFTGIIAVMGSSMPEFMKKRLPEITYLPVRILACLLAGMMTWIMFQWIYLRIPPVPTWASVFGAIGLSIGFIINTRFRPPAVVTFGTTAIAYFAVMFLFNNNADFFMKSNLENPLLYFDLARHTFTIGLPMVLIYAVGTNAHILYQAFFGGSTVSSFLEKGDFDRKQKRKKETPAVPAVAQS